VFDTIRIRTTSDFSGGIPGFRLDNLAFTVPQTRFAGELAWKYGAEAIISGPVGARADFFDLYGRPMVQTIALGPLQNSTLLLVDLNDDGIPDFNDGIGSIRLSNTDTRTSFTLWGVNITQATTRPQDSDNFDPRGFSAKINESLDGSYDTFEQDGYGLLVDNRQQQNRFGGLPPAVGDVIVGSPYVAPLGTTTLAVTRPSSTCRAAECSPSPPALRAPTRASSSMAAPRSVA
jgi:hypothetical protein